jgi:hypothetical protein
LQKLYYELNQPSAFSSAKNLKLEAKSMGISPKEVDTWLLGQEIYTRYKPARKKFRLNFYNIKALHDVFEADLNDMRKLSEYNDGFCYFLTIICCLSRMVWAYPLKTKSGPEMARVLDQHFAIHPRPRLFQTDKGKEFIASPVQNVFSHYKINFRTLENRGKASMAEAINKNLKVPLWKHFEYTNTWRWLEPLNKIVHRHNHTVHSVTKLRPVDVTHRDVFQIWSTVYLNHVAPHLLPRRARRSATERDKVFQPGDYVRISLTKDFTEKGYTAKFSRQIYKVHTVTRFSPVRMYTLHDLNGEPLRGNFYSRELIKVTPPTTFRVERILKHRRRKGHAPEVLVRWAGYDEKFDSWEPKSALKNI